MEPVAVEATGTRLCNLEVDMDWTTGLSGRIREVDDEIRERLEMKKGLEWWWENITVEDEEGRKRGEVREKSENRW